MLCESGPPDSLVWYGCPDKSSGTARKINPAAGPLKENPVGLLSAKPRGLSWNYVDWEQIGGHARSHFQTERRMMAPTVAEPSDLGPGIHSPGSAGLR
jgi:hypothetical protein